MGTGSMGQAVGVVNPGHVQCTFPSLIEVILVLWLTRVNGRGVDVCCLQETRFSTRDRKSILSRGFSLYSTCFNGHSRRVSWPVSKPLHAAYALVFADPAERLCVLGVTIKNFPHPMTTLNVLICFDESSCF